MNKIPASQLDLLAWEPPAVVAAFRTERVRAATWEGRLARAVAETLHDAQTAGLSRETVAERMSLFLGERVSVNMLNNYASISRTDHRLPLARLLGLLHATGDRRLLQMLAEECGWAVIDAKYLPLIELAAVQEAEQALAKRARRLRSQAKAGGAL